MKRNEFVQKKSSAVLFFFNIVRGTVNHRNNIIPIRTHIQTEVEVHVREFRLCTVLTMQVIKFKNAI